MVLERLPSLRQWKRLTTRPHVYLLIILTILITLLQYSWILLDHKPDWLWYLVIFEFRVNFIGTFFYIPIIYSAAIYSWRGMLTMCIIAMAIVFPLTIYYGATPLLIFINMFYLFIPMLIVGYIGLELNWRDRERKTLMKREEERQSYVGQVFQAQEDERKRIAQELHDDAIHSLLLIANNVQEITGRDKKSEVNLEKGQVEDIRGEVLRVADDLRRLTLDLRPGIIDNLGFLAALRWLVDRLNQKGSIDARIVVEGEDLKIPHNTDVVIFRIVQEALNNISLHSGATEAVVTLEFWDSKLKLSIRDNGKGFTIPKRINSLSSRGKLGLVGIQERVRSLNGGFDIKSVPGQGTEIFVSVPL